MTSEQLNAIGIPISLHALANKVVLEMQGTSHDPVDILGQCVADPSYFAYQGGSDGTFSHMVYHGLYGNLRSLTILGGALSDMLPEEDE